MERINKDKKRKPGKYDEAFKRMVISEYRSGRWSMEQLRRRYGLAGIELVALLCAALSNSCSGQSGWVDPWLGGVRTSYEQNVSTLVSRPELQTMYGVRLGLDATAAVQLSFDVGFMKRSVEQRVYTQFSSPPVLISTTRATIKGVSVGFATAVRVLDQERWEARMLWGGGLSRPTYVSMDVLTPFSTGTRYTNDGESQHGWVLRIGGRFAYHISDDLNICLEISGWSVLKDEYEWFPNHGPGIQPVLPARLGGVTSVLALDFRLGS